MAQQTTIDRWSTEPKSEAVQAMCDEIDQSLVGVVQGVETVDELRNKWGL